MKVRQSLLILSLVAAFAVAGLVRAQQTGTGGTPVVEDQDQTVQLTYAPEDGAVYEIADRTTRVSMSGDADAVTDVRQRNSQLTVAKGEDGFMNRVMIAWQSLSRNGSAIPSPLYPALVGLELVYELDAEGALTAITGHDGIKGRMAEIFPGKLAGTLDSLLNYEALRQQDAQRYNEIHGPYAGAMVTLVENDPSVASHQLPSGGSLPVYTLTTISHDEGMLVVRRMHSSDAKGLAESAQSDSVTEESLLALAGDLMAELPAAHASAAIIGEEETTVEVSGALVTSQTVRMRYEHSPRRPPGIAPVTNSTEVTTEFTANRLPPDETGPEATPAEQP